jgi:hypothetical protein
MFSMEYEREVRILVRLLGGVGLHEIGRVQF